MRLWEQITCLVFGCMLMAGCSYCCGLEDFTYPVFHSRYTRVDPEHGRVGSVFSDPNVTAGPRPLTNAEAPKKDNSDEDADGEFGEEFNLDTDQDAADPDTETTDTNFQTENWREEIRRWR